MKRGFTLIELSIVLVIIGLIVGGILVGRTLIHQAELRKMAGTIEQFKTASMTFKLKYDYLPGDLPNQANFFTDATCLANSAKCSGNGDGMVKWNSALTQCREDLLYAHNLLWAGLINKSMSTWNIVCNGTPASDSMPMLTDDPDIRVRLVDPGYQVAATNYWWLYFSPAWHSIILGGGANAFEGTIIPEDAQSIDTKYDDGLPRRGLIQAEHSHTAIVGDRHCRAAGGDAYELSYTDKTNSCRLRFTMPF